VVVEQCGGVMKQMLKDGRPSNDYLVTKAVRASLTPKCRYLTYGLLDVTDLGWSPGDRFLASVGLDSKCIIWCGNSLEMLRKLDQHQGFVKGVCWDPVGQFFATQSDDKSVKIWRTTDWGLEATVTKPFQDSPGSTFFRRLRCAAHD